MIELAFCFMGFMLLTMGVIDFGWAAYTYNTCLYAGRVAARWASTQGSQSTSPATADDVKNQVLANATAVNTAPLTITPCWIVSSGSAPTIANDGTVSGCNAPTGNNSPGSYIWVNVRYEFAPLSYLAIKQKITFSSTSQFVINN